MGTHWVDRFNPAKLRRIRIDRGLTQAQLADRLGRFREVINHYETGANKPRAHTLRELADELDVTIDDFLDPGPADMSSLRKRLGLTQADVAAALGVSAVTYQRYETRRSTISEQQLHQLAEILGSDPGVLAGLLRVRRGK